MLIIDDVSKQNLLIIMTKLLISLLRPLFFAGMIAMIASSCTMVDNKDQKALSYGTCEGCHTDYEHLKLVYTPDTAAPAGGCGGTAPHYEPYDRVYLGGSGYDAYKGTVHDMACTKCHDGVDYESNKEKAHKGLLKHPSTEYEERCGKCHATITANFTTNMHNGIGQMDKVTKRSGLSGHAAFADLPEDQIEGYNANCATCHGTCGNCHVVRPPIAGGGLSKGHQFIQEPDMLNTCVSCHTSRGGHAYLGRGTDLDPTIVPDVHLTYWGPGEGYECMDCHTGAEIHGNGEVADHRYDYSDLPTCTQCHQNLSGVGNDGKIYHEEHGDNFNCQVCHSQDYNSCGECHVHGDGARIPAYLDFKIALNPLQNPDENHDFDFALVRRTLAAPDNWDVYEAGAYPGASFDAFPMFNYTTPHNIIKVTSRTVADASRSNCFLNCHIRNEGGEFINKDLYLFMDVLEEPWQVSSTGFMTVDGELPTGWFIDATK